MPTETVINDYALEESAPPEVHLAGSAVLFAVVAESFGVNVTQQDRDDWKTLLGVAYAIDHVVDDKGKDIDSTLSTFLHGGRLEGASDFIHCSFRSYIENQSAEDRANTIQKLGCISLFVADCSEAESVNELVDARLAEANLFASFLELHQRGPDDYSCRVKFNNWLHAFSRTGYLVDSLEDMTEDYNKGASAVAPSVMNRLKLAKAAIKESVLLAPLTPRSSLLGILKVGYEHQARPVS